MRKLLRPSIYVNILGEGKTYYFIWVIKTAYFNGDTSNLPIWHEVLLCTCALIIRCIHYPYRDKTANLVSCEVMNNDYPHSEN